MDILMIIFGVIVCLPLIGVVLFAIFYPRESALFGKRWQYKNENLEPSDEYINYIRTVGIGTLVISLLIIALLIFRFWAQSQ